MPKVMAEHVFNLPIDELWHYLGDFGDTGKWSGRPKDACIQEGEGVGALRTLIVQDGRVIIDRLEAQTDYSYTYSVVEGPLPYVSYRATMAVEAVDAESTRFTWTGEFEPKGVSEAESVTFTEGIYAMGIAMMRKTIQRQPTFRFHPQTRSLGVG
ncbi:MAG: SRPBCC family protein [Pseudomonadota bacterium]